MAQLVNGAAFPGCSHKVRDITAWIIPLISHPQLRLNEWGQVLQSSNPRRTAENCGSARRTSTFSFLWLLEFELLHRKSELNSNHQIH